MVCLNCGRRESEFKNKRKFQEHLNKCGSGIKYDLKITSALTRQHNQMKREIQKFICNICGMELFRFPHAELNNDKNLSIDMKKHDLTHDGFNTWIASIVIEDITI